MNVLVTGATGFIGKELLKHLCFYDVTAISREKKADHNNIKWKHLSLENLLASDILTDKYDVVIHLAGLAHVLNENSDDPLTEFRKVNRDITVELAKQLAANGLKRFVFVSSIGVNGVTTENQQAFTESSVTNPHSAYAVSKYEAELELSNLAKALNFELVVIRPPLVYGANAPGNFGRLIQVVKKRLPLPFASISNKRSYVSVTNLASFLVTCATHNKAANQTFLISDGLPISTSILLQKLMKALSKKSVLLPLPKSLVKFLLQILGKKEMAVQLLDDLEVDNSKSHSLLGWFPVETMDEALQKIKD
jgi:nucleoside-diphosphate-sugar epimerase